MTATLNPISTASTRAHTHVVLCIAADDPTRRALGDMLREDGQTAVETIAELAASGWQPPDIILIDDDPPAADGADLCRQIRLLPGGDTVPIIVLSSRGDDGAITRAFEAGAADYLLKPVHPLLLRHRIRQFLKVQQERSAILEGFRVLSGLTSDYAYSYRVHPDGSLTKEWSTQAFYDISGYSPEELVTDGWRGLIHPDDVEITERRYRRLLAGETDVTEFRIVTKGGSVRWLLDHGYPVWNEHEQRVTHIYGAAQDITQRKEDEARLHRQAAELQARNEELDAFAYTVAHNLKNPIATMMGFASLTMNYLDRMTEDKVKEHLSLILEGGYKLKSIINALLMLAGVSKIDNPEIAPLDMHAVVEQAISRLAYMIGESQAQVMVPPSWPCAVGYGPWVEEVWANYISNAVKYGGQPPRIELGADEAKDGMIRFWVRDNGRGLSAEEQQRVFTPFTRLNQVKIEGHGLGLSVVQRIVQKLNGQVAVESIVGHGSTFSFTLPAAPPIT